MVAVAKTSTPTTQGMQAFPKDAERFVIARLSEIDAILKEVQVYCQTGSVEGLRMAVLYRWGPISIPKAQFVSLCIGVFYELANELDKEFLLRS